MRLRAGGLGGLGGGAGGGAVRAHDGAEMCIRDSVCTAYEVDGKTITDFPSTPTLMRCKPAYTMLPLSLIHI